MTQNKIGHFFVYFRRMMKFYDLRAKAVPQVLFVLLLAATLGLRIASVPIIMDYTIYFQQLANTLQDVFSSESINDPAVIIEKILEIQNSVMFSQVMSLSLKILGLMAVQQVFLMILSFFYLGAYLCDLESEGSSFSCYIRKFKRALPRYIGFNLIFYLTAVILLITGLFLFALVSAFIPVLYFATGFIAAVLIPVGLFIIQVIFIFKDITFLDTGVTVLRNLKLSAQLSAGNRMMIARNIIFIECLNLLIRIFVVESQMVSLFIISFFEVIIILIKQRLIALMYLSRTRRIRDISTPVAG